MATIRGSNQSEEIYGTEEGDVILALWGEDSVYAGGGADRVLGDSGDDYLLGEAGADDIDGGRGHDLISTGWNFEPGGVDIGRGRAGDDTMMAEGGESFHRGDSGDDTMYAWGQGHAVLHGGTDDDRVTVWCEPDPAGRSPLPGGAPNQVFDVLLGTGRNVMDFNAWGDGSIGWARLDDLDRGQDRLAVSVYDQTTGRTIKTAEVFGLLDANRDGRLAGDDGATFFGEVFADDAGLHLRLQDDWLSLAGETTLVASDFEMTSIA